LEGRGIIKIITVSQNIENICSGKAASGQAFDDIVVVQERVA